MKNWKRIFLIGGLVALSSQLYVNLFTDSFRISGAIVLLPVLLVTVGRDLSSLMIIFVYFLVFRVLGSNYDAAVMTSGFCGFGMGATPNAMANMQAITDKYGPAPTAYFVVPLVGSLFIDFVNALIITGFMTVLG